MMKDSDRILAQLLDECADLLLQGESLASCLAHYPEDAASLAPLLQSIVSVRGTAAVAPRPAHVAAASRARFMATAAKARRPLVAPRRSQTGPVVWQAQLEAVFATLRPLPRGLLATLLVVFVVGVLATGVVGASADALPGDPLYNVKLATEQAQLWLTLDPVSREALDQQLQSERVNDAETILQMGRAVEKMPLLGRLDAYNEAQWIVSGLVVVVAPETTIVGTPAIGAVVRGEVRAPGNGSLVATYLGVESPAPAGGPAGYSVVTVAPSRPAAAGVRAPTRRPLFYPRLPTAVRPRRTLAPAVIVTPRPTATRTAVRVATTPPATPMVGAASATPTSPSNVVVATATPIPPAHTGTATAASASPTGAPALPTSTAAAPVSTNTAVAPAPTSTGAASLPTTAIPANTPVPPTNTRIPPANTSAPATSTSPPPANTSAPATSTRVPPANTSAPVASSTPVPHPSATSVSPAPTP